MQLNLYPIAATKVVHVPVYIEPDLGEKKFNKFMDQNDKVMSCIY